MRELKKEEMLKIEGGASAALIASVVTAVITFIIGALNGYSNPKKCNN